MSASKMLKAGSRCQYCHAPLVEGCFLDCNRGKFCDKMCKAASLGNSLLSYYLIPERLRPADKFWFIDLPLNLYNVYYHRDVIETAFVESVTRIIRLSKAITISKALFDGYYAATRATCKDYIPHDIYMRGHINPRFARHVINKSVFQISSCNFGDRATSMIVKGSRKLVDWGIINPDDVGAIKITFREIQNRVKISVPSNTFAAVACINIITKIIKKKAISWDVAVAFGIPRRRIIGSRVARSIRRVVEWMANEKLITDDQRTTCRLDPGRNSTNDPARRSDYGYHL